MVRCENCGNVISASSKFCPTCGNTMQPTNPVPPQNFAQQQQNYGQPQNYQQYNSQYYGQGAPQNYNQYNTQIYQDQKSKIAAGLLGLFLGTLGIHNFYLGYIGKAVAQLVLTILGYITLIFIIGGVFLAITGIWAVIEGIMILVGAISVDGKGVPLKD